MLRRLPFLLAFLVLARAIAPALGYLVQLERHFEHVVFLLQKGEAATVRLDFSKAEKGQIKWIKKGREFRIGNQLFDVQKMVETGDSTIIFGHFDEKENCLHTAFSAQKTGDENDFSKAAWAAFHVSPMEVLEHPIFRFYIFLNRKTVFFYLKNDVSPFLDTISPPPKCAFFS